MKYFKFSLNGQISGLFIEGKYPRGISNYL